MASPTVADYLLTRLREWGTEYVFAYPGDGINGILAAWGRADDQPRFIQARLARRKVTDEAAAEADLARGGEDSQKVL